MQQQTRPSGFDTSYEWKIILVLSLTFGLVGLDRFILPVLFPTFMKELGLSYQDLGNLVGILAVFWGLSAFAMGFLLSFEITGLLEPLLTAEQYFGFVTTLFIVFALVMQFPFVLVLLSKTGIVTVQRLKRNRRYVAVAIVIFAVVVTPGGDPFSPTIMALVMYPLYELSIYLIGRSERPAAAQPG